MLYDIQLITLNMERLINSMKWQGEQREKTSHVSTKTRPDSSFYIAHSSYVYTIDIPCIPVIVLVYLDVVEPSVDFAFPVHSHHVMAALLQ